MKSTNILSPKSQFPRICVSMLFALGLLVGAPRSSAAVVVNINATVNGGAGPTVDVLLDAGTYLVTPIDVGTPGALYTAWNAWDPNVDPPMGCDVAGVCSVRGWLNEYKIEDNGTGDVPVVTISSGHFYQTPGLAFASALSYQFTLSSQQIISFFISDFDLGNNQGGMSLDVSAVPLPTALPLFASGLGLMGLFGWSRRRRAAAAA